MNSIQNIHNITHTALVSLGCGDGTFQSRFHSIYVSDLIKLRGVSIPPALLEDVAFVQDFCNAQLTAVEIDHFKKREFVEALTRLVTNSDKMMNSHPV